MSESLITAVDRRSFLTRVMPACSFACLYAGALSGGTTDEGKATTQEDVHKFDAEFERTTTPRRRVMEGNRNVISFIKTLQGEMDEEERRIVDLKLEERSNEEIARALDCSERTVRRLLDRTRSRLERILEDS